MQSKAATVASYLASLAPERRKEIETVRKVILANLDGAYEEGMQYGMIGYYVPHSLFPAGYHCDPKQPLPFAALGSQKNHIGVYLMCVYGHAELNEWFRNAWAKTGKKLDMGKACVRFKRAEEAALEVIGEAIRRVPAKKYIEFYEKSREGTGAGGAKKKNSAAAKKPTVKKKVAKKVAKKKAGGRR